MAHETPSAACCEHDAAVVELARHRVRHYVGIKLGAWEQLERSFKPKSALSFYDRCFKLHHRWERQHSRLSANLSACDGSPWLTHCAVGNSTEQLNEFQTHLSPRVSDGN